MSNNQQPTTFHLTEDSQPASFWVKVPAFLVAGLCCAGLAYAVISTVGIVFPTPPEMLNQGAAPTPEELKAAATAQLKTDCNNGMVWLGIAGAIVGAGLNLANGLIRKAGGFTFLSGIAGLVLGGIAGAASAYCLVTYHSSIKAELVQNGAGAETQLMLMHAIGWAAVGCATGLCFGLADKKNLLKTCAKTAVVGLIAGGIAGAAYPTAIGMIAPIVDEKFPIPPAGAGLAVWLTVPTVLISLAFSRTS